MAEQWWTPKRKRDVAKRMIGSGHKNDEIKQHIIKACGSGISSSDLAEIRASLAKPKRQKKNGKISKEDVMVLQGQDLTSNVKELLRLLKIEMELNGIQKIEMSDSGDVKVIMLQDMSFRV
jgi:hypothetical protein